MIPERLISPTVGFIETIPHTADGEMREPSVSVPTATAQRLAATATAEPELEPEGLRSSAYGFLVSPPRPLQPLVEFSPRKFAHSLKFVFPKMIAPASREVFCATNESTPAQSNQTTPSNRPSSSSGRGCQYYL